ncbi:crAss001_48 related protein [Sphingobacterium sp. 2149]|uniref:crAss001_48 related protein n=1 Tax=Sphingobacterium sp. 2149 TaxID=2817763 RepID=UPI0028600E80|nr:hypothetical protein [Sphingobacterium sp. 2149]
METFLDRLKIEHDELHKKIKDLSAFISTDDYYKLSKANKILLSQQLNHMVNYREILIVRLELNSK